MLALFPKLWLMGKAAYRSRHTAISLFGGFSGIAVSIYISYLWSMCLMKDLDLSLFATIVLPIAALGVLQTSLSVLITRFVVDLRSLTVHRFWNKKHITWDRVEEVWLYNNYVGSYDIGLAFPNQRKVEYFFTGMAGDSNELCKAIMEAAIISNPKIKLRGVGEAAYGAPPFGIFSEDRKDIA